MANDISAILSMIRQLWDIWDVPLFVMFSLALQIFLVWFAALRKRVSHQVLHISIWMAYLLADWVAAFTIGLIHYKGSKSSSLSETSPLLSVWAPFLVVHLGGPDTITAFSLEDNELWRRHLLRLIAQAVATGNILYQMPPSPALLWVPTLLVFICGLIKYGERVWALYTASMGQFRHSVLREPDPGPNYAMLMQEYALTKDALLSSRIAMVEEPELEQDLRNFEVRQEGSPLRGPQMIKDAYRFYQRFKGLIVDFEYSFRDRNKSVMYFLSLKDEDAFRVVETELNFMYDAFYTKSVVLHRRKSYIIRGFCLCSMLIAFGVFSMWDILVEHRARAITSHVHMHTNNDEHVNSKHIRVTYILLLGGIALDVISILLIIFSNWSVAFLMKDYSNSKRRMGQLDKLLAFKARWLSSYPEAPHTSQLLFQPWCRSICGFSLFKYYVNRRSPSTNKLLDGLGLKVLADGLTYVHTSRLSHDLKQLILEELKTKSKYANSPHKAKHLCSARGDWVLLNSYGKIKEVQELMQWITNAEYDESLLLWHIATEICYYTARHFHYQEISNISKALSDYMVYLLVMKPMMISNVAGISDLRLLDTEAEALRFIKATQFSQDELEPERLYLNMLSRRLMSVVYVNAEIMPREVQGTRSKSVLFEACRLADRLLNLPMEIDKWQVLNQVWIELLCYAACHCRPINHVDQLSKGGELITVVWLLMNHLGLGMQFNPDDGPTRFKLVVDEF